MIALAATALLAANGLLLQLETHVAAAVPLGTITEFSAGLDPQSHPEDLLVGPDGNLWFTDEGTHTAIGRIMPDGMITEFTEGLTNTSDPRHLVMGPDGNLWFTDRGAIGRITPNGEIREFPAVPDSNSHPGRIAVGPYGNLWFTESGSKAVVGRITSRGEISEFSTGLNPGSKPEDIMSGSNGNLWFTDGGTSTAIGRITPIGEITEFSTGLESGSTPEDIVPDPDGDLWFADNGEDSKAIGQITPNGEITEFTEGLGATCIPFCWVTWLTRGSDGNLWFRDGEGGSGAKIGRITPVGTISEFGTGQGIQGSPQNLVLGPDGNVWFVAVHIISASDPSFGTAIGRITPDGVVSEFSVGLNQDPSLSSLTAGPDGNVWFIDDLAIGRITTTEEASQTTQSSMTSSPRPTTAASNVKLIGTRFATKRSGKVAIKLTCAGIAICRGKLTITIKGNGSDKGKKRRFKTVTIATATFSIRAGKTAIIKLKLNVTGRTMLGANRGRLGARLTILKSSPSPTQTHTDSVVLVQTTTKIN